MINYSKCIYCNSFPNGLWNFVGSYLDNTNINDFQHKYVEQYYINLINDFLNTQFYWEQKQTEFLYKYVKDLSHDMICESIDCLGVQLGWGPKCPGDKYISNAYSIYMKFFKTGS